MDHFAEWWWAQNYVHTDKEVNLVPTDKAPVPPGSSFLANNFDNWNKHILKRWSASTYKVTWDC